MAGLDDTDPEPFRLLPRNRWIELQDAFKEDWPRGISGYAALEVQKQLAERGVKPELTVYYAYGDIANGMVGINDTVFTNEVFIQCPTGQTRELTRALKMTNIIDWDSGKIIVPNAPHHIIDCIRRAAVDLDMEMSLYPFMYCFHLENGFENVTLPPNITFGLIRAEHTKLVNSTWPHRFKNSKWIFEALIERETGYGIFVNNRLVSWVFIREIGPLFHLYTLEEERRKGYGTLLLKMACNLWLSENKPVFAFLFRSQDEATSLLKKLGFVESEEVAWVRILKKDLQPRPPSPQEIS